MCHEKLRLDRISKSGSNEVRLENHGLGLLKCLSGLL